MKSRLIPMLGALALLSASAHAGVIEICKDADPVGSLNGFFSFTIAGQQGTVQVPVGACTDSFVLPDGLAVINEVPDADSFLELVLTFPDDRLISFDPQTGTTTVLIVPGDLSDPSTETVVDFINAPAVVPEPGTGLLVALALGLGGTFVFLRKRAHRVRLPAAGSQAETPAG